jgi:L-lactate dehydrogenase complex protein LldG
MSETKISETPRSPTSATRDRIFAKLRTSLEVKPGDTSRDVLAAKRIAALARHMTPARALLPKAELRAQFTAYLTKGQATVVDVPTLADLPTAIATYLRDHNRPAQIRMGADARWAALPWNAAPGVTRLNGRAQPEDEVSLSYAVAAAAETGTLVLASGPDNPVTLNYLPETHLVALDAATLVGAYEDAIDIVRTRFGNGTMPRTLNFISGPSRTSDIGGKTVMGAHGPRYLAIFVIG